MNVPFLLTEIASIFAAASGTLIASILSKRNQLSSRRLLFLVVAGSWCNLAILAVSGLFLPYDNLPAGMHVIAGHLMLPLVAAATGLWLGASWSRLKTRPSLLLLRLPFFLFLWYLCLSNTWTGYLGPSRFDFDLDSAHGIRFAVFHEFLMPILIGMMLLIWLWRSAKTPPGDGVMRSA